MQAVLLLLSKTTLNLVLSLVFIHLRLWCGGRGQLWLCQHPHFGLPLLFSILCERVLACTLPLDRSNARLLLSLLLLEWTSCV